jgi:hypothetical protein
MQPNITHIATPAERTAHDAKAAALEDASIDPGQLGLQQAGCQARSLLELGQSTLHDFRRQRRACCQGAT